jgi:hypothetical protein
VSNRTRRFATTFFAAIDSRGRWFMSRRCRARTDVFKLRYRSANALGRRTILFHLSVSSADDTCNPGNRKQSERTAAILHQCNAGVYPIHLPARRGKRNFLSNDRNRLSTLGAPIFPALVSGTGVGIGDPPRTLKK